MTICRSTLAIAIPLSLFGCAVSNPKPDEPRMAEITRLSGPPIRVPLDGPLATLETRSIVKRIEELDAKVNRWRSSASGTPEVVAAIQRVAIETREDAVNELEKAITIARSTSGPLDLLFGSPRERVNDAINMLGSNLPASVLCKTQITALPEGAFIHYMNEGDFANGYQEWTSYTWGQPLAIGRYRFRVTKSKEYDYKELVYVTTDPKVMRLQPPPGAR